MRQEVLPKNILMIGPTGVGKTEIARRLANLAQAPFLKVEATKFTEVGYVGRDVEQIVRDLVEIALHMTRERMRKQVQAKAELATEDKLVERARRRTRVGRDPRQVPPDAARGPSRGQGDRGSGRRPGVAAAADVRHPRHARLTDGHAQSRRDVLEGVRRAADQGEEDVGRPGPRSSSANRRRTGFWTRTGWSRRRSSRSRTTASSSSTRSTRSPGARSGSAAPTSAARACSATCCR